MKLTKLQQQKASDLIVLTDAPTGYKIVRRKLSDFYSSRSTRYAGCLNKPPFVIIRDEAAIVAAGYSKLCKAVVTLEPTADVIEVAEKKVAEDKAWRAQQAAREAKRMAYKG